MRLSRSFALLTAAATLLLIMPRLAEAGSFEVAPTSLALGPSETAVFYIINHSTAPIVAQVEGYSWRQNDTTADTKTDADRFDDTSDLIISPPMVRLIPNQQQTIRLMVKPNASVAGERTFRLVVSEIPDANADPGEGIRMLLQFSVPVFVHGKTDLSPKLEWTARKNGDGLTLTARNQGALHAKLSNISLETSPGQSLPINGGSFRYILAGADAVWTLPEATAASGQPVHVKAFDDIASTSIDVPLTVQ